MLKMFLIRSDLDGAVFQQRVLAGVISDLDLSATIVQSFVAFLGAVFSGAFLTWHRRWSTRSLLLLFAGIGYLVDRFLGLQQSYATAAGTLIGFTIGMIRFIQQALKGAEDSAS